jgi:hypothetical protein
MEIIMELTQWKHFKRHPLSEVWGDMSEVEFDGLLSDMREHGYDFKQQIWLYDGLIVDGWHRHCAAVQLRLKQPPSYEVFKGSYEEAELFVTRRNLLRRHLDVSQRALIAGKMANLSHGGDRRSESFQTPKTTVEKAAADMNVGVSSATAGKRVAELGSPTLQKAVAEGIVSITDAAKIVDEIASVQNAAVRAVRKGKSRTVSAAVKKPRSPKPPPSEMEIHSKVYQQIEELIGGEYKDEDGLIKRVKAILAELRKLREERPHGTVGLVVCPLCKGFGRIPKKLQDDLFNAVVKVTGADATTSAAHIVKVCKILLTAEPPYTPAEVLLLPRAVEKRGLDFTITVGCIPKYIGWVRQPIEEKGLGRLSRVEAPPGKYANVGITVRG